MSTVSITKIDSCCSAAMRIINYYSAVLAINHGHNHCWPRVSADTIACPRGLGYYTMSNGRFDGMRMVAISAAAG